MKYNLRSWLHVALQIGIFFYLFITTRFYWHLLSLLFMAAGFVLAVWAIYQFRKGVLTAFPDPMPGISLILSGPYSKIRHPMYSSLFMGLTGLLLLDFSWWRIVIAVFFTVNQVLKLLYEEKMLLQRMPEYQKYMQNTWRLFPFIY
ncbi:MAG: isoprenylcysteine carboxylmethyltransferase family protein [Bacteroidota bacterium]|nr:MAG: isoprenylcysteine carboxylmethyltransferase family protein [Bacteroidota bacterium]